MLEVKFLGQFEVLRDGKRLTIPTRNAQSLFAYLLLNAGKAQRRERLAGLLWPDSSEGNARSNLRHELWRLRKALGTEGEYYFLVDDLTIAFNPQSEYSLDVLTLESASKNGSTAKDLITALSTYSGELLPGFYDEWVFVERDRLAMLFETKVTRLLAILQAEGRWPEVMDWANRWIALGGWPEPAYRALISAYANTGESTKAAATFERLAQALQKELGVKPSEQTQALYKRLKVGWKTDPQSVQSPIPPVDKAAPAHPPFMVRRSNLPKPLTSFIGREKEIQQVERMVSSARLVTITGSGGVGKTRLAIQVAEVMMHEFEDGVYWVALATLFETATSQKSEWSHEQGSSLPASGQAGLAGADLIAQAVVKVLRIPELPGLPLLDGLVEYLRDKQLLLVLDNCEHLVEACAALAERVLGDCPQVTVLATSREALGVPGEKAWALPSLSLPVIGHSHSFEFDNLTESEAVRLFNERAGDILPGYQPGEAEAATIAQICLRLDGIPLAIELAAARMNLLSPQEIAARLDRRFSLLTDGNRTALPRHQTLLAAIEWSHDLLSEPERVLFRRLSIFPGSFNLDATETICISEGIHRDEVLTLIGRLVDKSLLNVESVPSDRDLTTRYHLLDTIRGYGRLKLEESGETKEIRDRHADYFVRLAEDAGPKLLLHDQVCWYKLLRAENDNIRAVIEWCAESDQAESALRLVGTLLWFWWTLSLTREGLNLALITLALPSAKQFKEYRARALNTAGALLWVVQDMALARQNLEEALSLLKESDDKANLAWSMQLLGLVLTSEGKYDLADRAMKDGVAIAQNLGELTNSSFSLIFQGDIALQRGDLDKARSVYEENANRLREIGNVFFMAYPIRRLGYLALERNDIPQALDYFQESLALNQEVGDERAVCACLTSLAVLALYLDKSVKAARLLGVVEHQLDSHLLDLLYQDQVELGRLKSRLQTRLDAATFEAAFSAGWEMSEGQVIDLVEEILAGIDSQDAPA